MFQAEFYSQFGGPFGVRGPALRGPTLSAYPGTMPEHYRYHTDPCDSTEILEETEIPALGLPALPVPTPACSYSPASSSFPQPLGPSEPLDLLGSGGEQVFIAQHQEERDFSAVQTAGQTAGQTENLLTGAGNQTPHPCDSTEILEETEIPALGLPALPVPTPACSYSPASSSFPQPLGPSEPLDLLGSGGEQVFIAQHQEERDFSAVQTAGQTAGQTENLLTGAPYAPDLNMQSVQNVLFQGYENHQAANFAARCPDAFSGYTDLRYPPHPHFYQDPCGKFAIPYRHLYGQPAASYLDVARPMF
ncbi:UNVERIFIED_CONTAM: hypothetical protein FKN15_004121 [Acipenser sinensis]